MVDSGKYGLFFCKNTGDAKNLIEKVENNPEVLLEYRSKSRQRIVENYTWEKIVAQYYTLFNQILNGK